MNLEAAIKDLQDAMTVMAHLEKRQSELALEHSERIVKLEAESASFRHRTEQNLAEISGKLNGLIGYVGNWKQPPQQPS